MSTSVRFIDNEDDIPSLGTPVGRYASTCGYCSPPGRRSEKRSFHHVAGLQAKHLTCEVYQKMIDHGWRRSGRWCYKPDLRTSCCPQYTIRLDALAFKPSKSQRKIINRWNKYVLEGTDDESMDIDGRSRSSKSNPRPVDFPASIHLAESSSAVAEQRHSAHSFEIVLEPASFTPDKYALYVKYQRLIHNDHDSTPEGFKRFLVDSPLRPVPIPYAPPPSQQQTPGMQLPINYGSYHQLYKLDGRLIAIGVIDILPHCVSSVYFIYDPDPEFHTSLEGKSGGVESANMTGKETEVKRLRKKKWDNFSFGKLSALREIALARELHGAGAPGMGYLYMGFYIHTCQKMRYKAGYAPSYLADPETYEWYPVEKCIQLLDKYQYACFSSPDHSLVQTIENEVEGEEDIDGDDDGNSTLLPQSIPDNLLEDVRVLAEVPDQRGKPSKFTIPVHRTSLWDYDAVRREYAVYVDGLGADVVKEFVFTL